MADFMNDKEKYFSELRNLSGKYSWRLDRQERYNLYLIMQGYCLRKINKEGSNAYKDVLFEVCKEMVSGGSYTHLEDEVILPLVYKNIARAGIYAEEFAWTMKFIENYRLKLHPEFQNNVYNYCLALCYFSKAEYENSLKYLSVVKYENVYDKAEVNRLLLQIYFETGRTEELLSLIDTFKHFLHNDRLISVDVKKNLRNFMKFLNKVYRIKAEDANNFDIPILKKELESTRCYEKQWLLEKIHELKA